MFNFNRLRRFSVSPNCNTNLISRSFNNVLKLVPILNSLICFFEPSAKARNVPFRPLNAQITALKALLFTKKLWDDSSNLVFEDNF